jgi:hypothetical protein
MNFIPFQSTTSAFLSAVLASALIQNALDVHDVTEVIREYCLLELGGSLMHESFADTNTSLSSCGFRVKSKIPLTRL